METDGTNASAPANLKINQMFGVKTGKRQLEEKEKKKRFRSDQSSWTLCSLKNTGIGIYVEKSNIFCYITKL